MDRDTTVPFGEDLVHCLDVHDLIRSHHVDVLERGHDVADGLILEIEDGGDDGHFVVVETLCPESAVEGDEGFEAGFFVCRAFFFAEHAVEQQGRGVGEGIHDVHHDQHKSTMSLFATMF